MTLTPEQQAKLERLGLSNVSARIRDATGSGRGAQVPLQVSGVPNPSRGEVEDWIREQETSATGEDTKRHRQLMWWARVAGIGAVVGALAAIVAAVR